MGLIKESLNIDFVVESRLLTQEEARAISEFIRADKESSALLLQKQSQVSTINQGFHSINEKKLFLRNLKKNKVTGKPGTPKLGKQLKKKTPLQ